MPRKFKFSLFAQSIKAMTMPASSSPWLYHSIVTLTVANCFIILKSRLLYVISSIQCCSATAVYMQSLMFPNPKRYRQGPRHPCRCSSPFKRHVVHFVGQAGDVDIRIYIKPPVAIVVQNVLPCSAPFVPDDQLFQRKTFSQYILAALLCLGMSVISHL